MTTEAHKRKTPPPPETEVAWSRRVLPLVVMLVAVGLQQFQQYEDERLPFGLEAVAAPLRSCLKTPPAATKPYGTFEEFYPHYLHEHRLQITKRFHFVGTTIIIAAMILYPRLMYALGSAGLLGYVIFPFFRWQETGIAEALIVMTTFVIVAWISTGSWKLALFIPVCGYTFAWMGHFFFEQNRPATFIYPTFSLFGDFRMWYEMLTSSNGLHI